MAVMLTEATTRREALSRAADLPELVLHGPALAELELLLQGLLADWQGYGQAYGLEALPLPAGLVVQVRVGGELALRDSEGVTMALLQVRTLEHGAAGTVYVGGPVQGLALPAHHDWQQERAALAKLSAVPSVAWVGIDPPLPALCQALRDRAQQQGLRLVWLPQVRANAVESLRHHARMRLFRGLRHADEPLALLPLADATDLRVAECIVRRLGVQYVAGASLGQVPQLLLDEVDLDEALPAVQAADWQQCLRPRSLQGLTVFMTGLSGAGKSTVASALRAYIMEHHSRQVSLLDGDQVRRHLSSELGFSREHRDLNVLRIGYVASEVTRHGGIAICAPIAPYAATRAEVRRMVECHGGFIEVHIATPIEVCEQRDRKGLYALARAGRIEAFTGVSDPYEVPEQPELRLDTSMGSPLEAAATICHTLQCMGYLAS